VTRPRFALRRREEQEEDVENATVVQLVPVGDEVETHCKSACAEEAEVVSQTWAHHTELFG
jgi:hypothetical protein